MHWPVVFVAIADAPRDAPPPQPGALIAPEFAARCRRLREENNPAPWRDRWR